MMISENKPEHLIRTKDGILADIWDALWKEDIIRSRDLGSFSIEVKGGEVYLNGYLPQDDCLPLIESTIYSVVGVLAVHNQLRTNDGLLADIWDALRQEDAIRSLDLNSLSIEVKDGEAYLNGHLSEKNNLLLVESVAHSIPGVVAVHNNLVADYDLTIQVAQALARDDRLHNFILPVNTCHGWIYLGGEVPTRELQHIVEEVAGKVPGVRGVITLPVVAGESPTPPKRALQPCIGAVVYGRDGEVGVVTQVVIRHQDRLVTHVVVRFNEIKDTNLVAQACVVPVTAIDLVKNGSLFLQRNGPSLNVYPALDPDDYPLAPFTWKAPYPYTAGEVLWSLKQLYEVPDTPPAASLEPISLELKADGTRTNPALVSV
jgi:osmotically-inducible protein OsmY